MVPEGESGRPEVRNGVGLWGTRDADHVLLVGNKGETFTVDT